MDSLVIQFFNYSVIHSSSDPVQIGAVARFDALMAAVSQPTPSTPPRRPTPLSSAPPVRQSNRSRTLSARGRAMAEEVQEPTAVQSEEHGVLGTTVGGKGIRARQNKTSEIDTTAKVLEMILEQLQSMGGLQQEVESLSGKVEPLAGTFQVLMGTVGSLCKTVESLNTRVTTLEAQNEALLEVVRKTATEQAKVTQSWAQIAAKSPAPPATSPSPPASSPSVPSGSLNPHSSISQTSNVSRSAIILDLSRTAVRSTDFGQLKDTIGKALKDQDQTKDIQCTGLQRRAGAEHQVKVTFESEEQARRVRKYDHWLQTSRFKDARSGETMTSDGWYKNRRNHHPIMPGLPSKPKTKVSIPVGL